MPPSPRSEPGPHMLMPAIDWIRLLGMPGFIDWNELIGRSDGCEGDCRRFLDEWLGPRGEESLQKSAPGGRSTDECKLWAR